jgi:hypothetical protein
VFAAMKSSAAVTHQYLTEARLVQGKPIARIYGVCAVLTEPFWLKPEVIIESWKRTGLESWNPSSPSNEPSTSA